jgi:hypothetical protein
MAPRPWLLPRVGDPSWPEPVVLAAAAIPEQGVEPSSKCAAAVTRRLICCCFSPLTSIVMIYKLLYLLVFIPIYLKIFLEDNK